MKRFVPLLLVMVVAFSWMLSADDEQSTYPYVAASYGGRYYFKMIPGKKAYYEHDEGTGIMCTLTREGEEQELWRVGGWYAFRTFPSYDGECLARLGNWPRGKGPSKGHLAVAFYKKGALVKQYGTADLIKNAAKVQHSVSHYEFLHSLPGFSGYDYDFSLITVDRVLYRFNVCTGEIVSWKQLP